MFARTLSQKSGWSTPASTRTQRNLIRQRGIEPVDTPGVGVSGISTTSGQPLFHDDLHGANVMMDGEGRAWIVDSTTIRLSPSERQLPTISDAIESAAALDLG